MALGKDQQVNSGKLYILKLKKKDKAGKAVPAFFEVSEKVKTDENAEPKWQPIGTDNRVSGDLTRIVLEKGEWEGSEYDLIKITLTDKEKDESYLLDLRMNLLSRSLYNSLLALETFNDLSISLYQSKKDDKSFDAVSLRQGDKLVNWAFKLDELPKIQEVKVGGKKVVDTSELDNFFLEHLKVLGEKVKGAKSNKAAKEDKVEAPKEEVKETASEVSDDDIF